MKIRGGKIMLSSITRPRTKELLNEYTFDVLVIGGGITGAGIALDAVTRGLTVALIEMQDFAGGTSSRSTKLVHGGLRYLKQFDFKVVSETGRERRIVYDNARHVTEPQRILLPIHRGGTFGKYSTAVGLSLYDSLARVRRSERRQMLTKEETIEKEPLLKRKGLLGGGYYVEYSTDDARLTIEAIKKAADKGALCLNYMKAESFIYNSKGKVIGVHAEDMLKGGELTIHANTIVNAAGPWVDKVREKDELSNKKRLTLTKGVHIVLDQSVFPLHQAIYFDAPDGRMIFAIPRNNKAYIGTTDTIYDGDPLHPIATEDDIDYIMNTVRFMFPNTNIKREDVESTWAGVRPLIYEQGKDPSEISRKDEIWEAPSGLITIAGGKLTGYRKMASEIVDLVMKRTKNKPYKPSKTKRIPLSGGNFKNNYQYESFIEAKAKDAPYYGLTEEEGAKLARRYGTNAKELFLLAKDKLDELSEVPKYLQAELLYGIHFEMIQTPADFFVRRTGLLYFDIDKVIRYKEAIIAMMAKELKYSELERRTFTDELEELIQDAKGVL